MSDSPSAEKTTAAAAERTVDFTQKLLFRCTCGKEVELESAKESICPECGRQINLQGLSESQTVSFCSTMEEVPVIGDGPDRTGEVLGHFTLISPLGSGGMGAVYRALDQSLERFVAVKVIRAQGSGSTHSSKMVSRLLDEAIAQARLNHPNVVTIYYVGREGEEPFFAMELLPGPTLEQRVNEGRLPYGIVIRYATQIVSALSQSAQQGLVHGDIKPSNLILADEKTVKLGDFGLARTESMPSDGGISGTLSYMAPELAEGDEPSMYSDMYALGVTLFELTFGVRPYRVSGSTLKEQIDSQQKAEVQFPHRWPSDIPERWRNVLDRMLAKDPQDRYSNYAELQSDLRKVSPVGITQAGVINRALAWFLDSIVQYVLFIPFLVLMAITASTDSESSVGNWLVWLQPLNVFVLAVPALYMWFEWNGWRTVGRYLFQQRVADSNGLQLVGKKRLVRNLLRNAHVWTQAGIIFLSSAFSNTEFLMPIFGMVLLFQLVDFLTACGPRRLAIHDRIAGSHVVLDTDYRRPLH